jgi:RHS repeat-associated protein
MTDRQGNTTSYAYNSQGLVQTVTDALNHQTVYSYNPNGTVASMTDANNHQTSYSYNTQGLVSQVTAPAPLGARSCTYNGYDALLTETDGNIHQANYGYDADGRVTSISYADGSSVGYGYDSNGNRTSVTDGTGQTTYTYNLLNQQTQKSLPNGQNVSYTWDGVGNLLSKTDSGGQVVYTYTPTNKILTVTDPQQAKTTFSYNPDDDLTQLAYPNGITENLSFNFNKQLTQIAAKNAGGTTLTSFSYSYTNPSNSQVMALRYSMTDGAGNTTSYTYDSLNRLTQAIQKNGSGTQIASYVYGYDPVGNLTSKNDNGSGMTLSYNAGNELSQGGATTYTYDGNGSGTGASTGATTAYNAQNQATSFTPAGGQATSMTYTGAGQTQRVAAGATSFQYDVTGLSVMTANGSSSYFMRTPAGQLLSERTSGATYYYLHDGLNSVVALTNSAGSVVNQYAYDPYGKTTNVSEQVSNPFRFDSALFDSNTGLYKMGERYYDPSIARWTQQDLVPGTVGLPKTCNRYAYAADDPIGLADPSGLTPCDEMAALLSSLLGSAAGSVLCVPTAIGYVACQYAFTAEFGVGGYEIGTFACDTSGVGAGYGYDSSSYYGSSVYGGAMFERPMYAL